MLHPLPQLLQVRRSNPLRLRLRQKRTHALQRLLCLRDANRLLVFCTECRRFTRRRHWPRLPRSLQVDARCDNLARPIPSRHRRMAGQRRVLLLQDSLDGGQARL